MSIRQIGIIFHGIGKPERELEPSEAPYWISVERFEGLLDAISMKPEHYRITFDDGNFSDYAVALPRLLERGLQADFFVLSGRIGRPGSLGEQEIRDILSAGMGIGSHGVMHCDWRSLDVAALRAELEDSKAALEELCGAPILDAAIPFGSWNASVLRALRQAGYESAWSSDGGWIRSGAFLKPRRSVRGDMDEAALQSLLLGQMGPLRRLRRGAGMALRRLT